MTTYTIKEFVKTCGYPFNRSASESFETLTTEAVKYTGTARSRKAILKFLDGKSTCSEDFSPIELKYGQVFVCDNGDFIIAVENGYLPQLAAHVVIRVGDYVFAANKRSQCYMPAVGESEIGISTVEGHFDTFNGPSIKISKNRAKKSKPLVDVL